MSEQQKAETFFRKYHFRKLYPIILIHRPAEGHVKRARKLFIVFSLGMLMRSL
jgi:hypothetical protein